ncbi:outer membrane protein assembly factor BamE [Methylibium sp. Root1272]|uniref:outer membrane protein assembly factor BamE n=1 Tax=Methylibium sp. Root1272 TaxID=1736441 RepID=UPI0007007594|nr:outer membrane protein assembly factor BamE [Methylibium sp. Root1272]KQW68876.1 cell envelope protein SmpA [Methylibium sp. Root1272]
MPSSSHIRALCLLLAPLVLGGCGSMRSTSDTLFGLITPYRVEVVQGNVVTQEMAAAVKPGMTRAQIRDTLGSPLLADIFHADRWDYVFTIRRPGAAYQQRRVTVLFDGDTMKSFEADELPSERDFVSSIDTKSTKGGKAPTLALNDEQLKALPVPAKGRVPEPSSAPQGPAREYPPLEAAP